MLPDAGLAGTSTARLARRLGVAVARVRAALATLESSGEVTTAADWVVDRRALAAPIDALLAGLAAFHRAQPLAAGMPLEEARARWFAKGPPPIVDRIVADLAAAGRVVARDTIALAGHRLALTGEESEVFERLEATFRAAGLNPPDPSPASLAAEYRRPPALVERVLQLLVKQKRLVRLDTLVFHHDALEQLKAEVAARKATAPGGRASVDVKAFKDTYGVSRKFAIPLLEFLDRERVTRRAGDVRIVL